MNKPLAQEILALSDQCVRCGMCMPHCPTNKLNNSEGYSPRGRIALWKNLAQNNLSLTTKTRDYLDSCLSCGTCDNYCPAGVKFSTLQNLGKSSIQVTSGLSLNKGLVKIFSSRLLSKALHYGLYIYQKLRLHSVTQIILTVSSRLKSYSSSSSSSNLKTNINRLYNTLPPLLLPSKYKTQYSAFPTGHHLGVARDESLSNNQITDVIIFVGCVNNLVAANKITAAIKILTTLGINTHISNKLHCCGAIQKHNGYLEQFALTKDLNTATLNKIMDNNASISHVLTLDTGCHPSILENFTGSSVEVSNIEQFLYQLLIKDEILLTKIKSLHYPSPNKTIYHYTPCSQREQLKQSHMTKNLLELIFNTNPIVKISEGLGCCGAAGTYMFTQPEMAEKFADSIINQFPAELSSLNDENKSKEHLICTTNTGCALHLNHILRSKYNYSTKIVSSLELIANL